MNASLDNWNDGPARSAIVALVERVTRQGAWDFVPPEDRDGDAFATIVHDAALDVLDDGPAKPVRIWSRVGRRPILAAGNSNGDIPMLRFCAHPSRPSLGLLSITTIPSESSRTRPARSRPSIAPAGTAGRSSA